MGNSALSNVNDWHNRDKETGRHLRNGHILSLGEVMWICEKCQHRFDAAVDADLFACGEKCVHPGQGAVDFWKEMVLDLPIVEDERSPHQLRRMKLPSKVPYVCGICRRGFYSTEASKDSPCTVEPEGCRKSDYSDEATLRIVFRTMREYGLVEQEAQDVIKALQDAGIVFREKKP